MPVEIKELIIRAVTLSEPEQSEKISSSVDQREERDALVQECVRQVMQILKKERER